MTEPLLTLQEAADLLGVSTRTVRRWVADGLLSAATVTLPAGRGLRFRASDLPGQENIA